MLLLDHLSHFQFFLVTFQDYLVAVDDSDEHTMSIWHSSSGERLADSVVSLEIRETFNEFYKAV